MPSARGADDVARGSALRRLALRPKHQALALIGASILISPLALGLPTSAGAARNDAAADRAPTPARGGRDMSRWAGVDPDESLGDIAEAERLLNQPRAAAFPNRIVSPLP